MKTNTENKYSKIVNSHFSEENVVSLWVSFCLLRSDSFGFCSFFTFSFYFFVFSGLAHVTLLKNLKGSTSHMISVLTL